LGVDGDFYINTAANTIYGPKTSGSWGSATNLVGPAGSAGSNGNNGTNGIDGKTIRSGSGVPSGGLGVDGDFYINTAANTIYGPKTSGSWGSATNLVGPAGATGAAGSNGSNGSNGTDGKTVRSGSGVPSGGLGVDGDFYINTAANTIYGPKTSGSWGSATNLIGPAGATGEQGPQGNPGSGGITAEEAIGYSLIFG
jgi:integrin beta 8